MTIFAIPTGLFLILPIIGLVVATHWNSFGHELASRGDQMAIEVSIKSLLVSIILIATFGSAYAYVATKFKGLKSILATLLIEIPAALPPAVSGLALLIAFGPTEFLGKWLGDHHINLPLTFAAVVMAQTFVSIPYFVRPLMESIRAIDGEIIDAAYMDAASFWPMLTKIWLPLLLPSFIGGIVLAASRGLGEFGATILFAGSFSGVTETIPLHIYTVFGENLNQAIALGTIMLILAVITSLLGRLLGVGLSRFYAHV